MTVLPIVLPAYNEEKGIAETASRVLPVATLLTLLSRQTVTDSASGMRVFKRETLEHIYPFSDGLNLTPVMITRAVYEGLKMEEIPIPYSERVGRSKLSIIRDGRIFMQSMLWTGLSYNPAELPSFKNPLDGQFGWTGLMIIFAGPTIALVALLFGAQSWEIGRLWFYMECSTLIFLVGAQLVVYWLLLRILEELSQREARTKQDIGSSEL